MIIVDTALAKCHENGSPIRVGMLGAGFMGRAIALQICNFVQGMELVAISNRHLDGATTAYSQAGVEDVCAVETVAQLEEAVSVGRYAVTDNGLLLCEAARF